MHSPPTDTELAQRVLSDLFLYSRRTGDRFFPLVLCHHWDAHAGLVPRRTRYAGTFVLQNGTLATPILVLSNTFDPVTSLASARYANARLGDNARLVVQKDGWGHCTVSQFSACTARIMREYMVEGKVLEEKEVVCEVDQVPWKPWKGQVVGESGRDDDAELMSAWAELGEQDWLQGSLPKPTF